MQDTTSNSNLVEITEQGVKKSFVTPVSSNPYESLENLTKENAELVPSKEKYENELKGYEFLKAYFQVPELINQDENKCEITYEAFLPSTKLESAIQDLIKKDEENLENRIISTNRELGISLRNSHQDSFDSKNYTVKGLFDFHDGNVLIGENEEYRLIDFESFSDMNVYDSTFKIMLSQMVSATTDKNGQFDERNLEKIKPALHSFMKGYMNYGSQDASEELEPIWFSGEEIKKYQEKGDIRVDLYNSLGQISPKLKTEDKMKIIDYLEIEILEPSYIFLD